MKNKKKITIRNIITAFKERRASKKQAWQAKIEKKLRIEAMRERSEIEELPANLYPFVHFQKNK